MSQPTSAIDQYIVKELASTEHEPDEAPLTIVCEPARGTAAGSGTRVATSMRLLAGTTPEEARAIANTLQAKVKRWCHVEASVDEAA